jgi:hypothetical protein
VRGGKPGQPRSPSHCRWDTNARQHGCCGPLSASTPSMFRSELATGADGAPTRCVCRLATRRAHRRDDNRSDGGTLGLGAALPHRSARRYDGIRRLRQHRCGNARGSPWPPCSDRQGPQRFCRRRVVPRLCQRAATCHFARVRGVGLFQGARPSDVPTIPRRHGLLGVPDGAPERRSVRDRARLPRGHHVLGPRARTRAQPAGRFK